MSGVLTKSLDAPLDRLANTFGDRKPKVWLAEPSLGSQQPYDLTDEEWIAPRILLDGVQ